MLLIMGEMKILKRERDFRKHPNCKERKKCRPASSTGKAYPTIQATSTGVPKFKTAAPTVLPPSLHSARQTVPPPSSTMMPSILETGSQTLLRTPITGSQTLHGNSQNLLSVTSSQNLLNTVLQAYTTTTTPILTATAATPILTATSTSSIPVFTDTTASPIIATTNASSATWSYMISQIMPPTALCTQTGSDPVTSSCFQIASYAQSQVSPLPTRTTPFKVQTGSDPVTSSCFQIASYAQSQVSPLPTRTTPFKVQQTQMPSFNNDWTTIVLDSTSASSEPSIASSTNETMTLDTSAANTFGSMPTAIETATAVPVGSAAMATRNSRFGVLLQSIVLSLLLAKI